VESPNRIPLLLKAKPPGQAAPIEDDITLVFLSQHQEAKGNIYGNNKQSGYRIWVYDLEGNPITRIKKDYEPVAVPEDIKKR